MIVGVLGGGVDVQSESAILAQGGVKVGEARQILAYDDGVHELAVVGLKVADRLAAFIRERKRQLRGLSGLNGAVLLLVDFQGARESGGGGFGCVGDLKHDFTMTAICG